MAFCEECGDYFHRDPDEYWKKLCLDCWKEKQEFTSGFKRDRVQELEEENRELRQEIFRLRYLSPLQAQVDNSFNKLVERHLKFLIFACHPDRNGGSIEAGEVTRRLLDFRDQKKNRCGGAGFGNGSGMRG